jgi:hypothetical protein
MATENKCNIASPQAIIIKARRVRWAGHVARVEEKRNAYRLLVGKPEGRRMDLGAVGCGDVDWTDLTQDRDRWRALVNSVLNLRGP